MQLNSELVRLFPEKPADPRLPFLAFFVDGYLPDEIDEALEREFPAELMARKLGDRLATNIDLGSKSSEIIEFLDNSKVWRSYVDAWQSRSQLENLVDNFYPSIRERYVRPWRWFLSRRLLKYNQMEVTVLLSVYRRGFQLAPHSDDKHKLISLIHYIPANDASSDGGGGTVFYSPKPNTRRRHLRQFSDWSRGIRKYLPMWLSPLTEASLKRRYLESETINLDERLRFDDLFERALDIQYRKNRISGFIKNDWSMHEVDLADFPVDEIRRAVLINVRIRPTSWTKVIKRIEAYAVRLKRLTRRSISPNS